MPALFQRWRINNRRKEGTACRTCWVNTELTETTCRIGKRRGIRDSIAARLPRQLSELFIAVGQVVSVNVDNVERTNTNHFSLSDFTGGRRNFCREARDNTLLGDFVEHFIPNLLNFLDLGKLIRASHFRN